MLFLLLTSFVVFFIFFALYNLSCVAEDAQRRRLAVSVASSSAMCGLDAFTMATHPPLLLSYGTAPTLWLTVNVLPIFSPIAIGNVAILLFSFIAFIVVILCCHLCIRKAKTIRVMFVYFRFFTFVVVFVKSSRVHKSAIARLSDMSCKVLYR